jgi:hypothetical protein
MRRLLSATRPVVRYSSGKDGSDGSGGFGQVSLGIGSNADRLIALSRSAVAKLGRDGAVTSQSKSGYRTDRVGEPQLIRDERMNAPLSWFCG